MSDRTYTEEQIRVACEEVRQRSVFDLSAYGDIVMEALTKPDIHPDVPVMYEHEPTRGRVLCFAEALESDKRRLQILIPEDKVREIVRRAAEHTGGNTRDRMLELADALLDEYRRTGK